MYFYICMAIIFTLNIEAMTTFLKYNKFDKLDTSWGLFWFFLLSG